MPDTFDTSPEAIERFLDLAEKATEAPWFEMTFPPEFGGPSVLVSCTWPDVIGIATMNNALTGELAEQKANAAFIAAARTMAPALAERVKVLEQMDREAATHVESVIALRTGFTGQPPYVGWKGLGLALTEALDERDALAKEVQRLRVKLDETQTKLRKTVSAMMFLKTTREERQAVIDQKGIPT